MGSQAPSGRGLNWFGVVVAGAALLLVVSTVLPWVRVSVDGQWLSPSATQHVERSFNGFEGNVGWGYLTLLCAFAAAALGVLGAVLRNGRLVGAAAIPGLPGLVSLGLVLARLDSARSAVVDGQVHGIPPALRVVLEKKLQTSLDVGWFLALLMTLVVIGVSVVAFIIAVGRPADAGRQQPVPGR
ncbi:hypothetical protein F8568_041795 [Actinomadura sp. LD22]|uniref:Uncharacterized protein n=1 Tax=Actinomadura physcomitrii TaxID=2650748 RepID=A0A6I4MVT7_9ACTN|nr:hypothetical protein [Actinomadura physcomitrii]MWA06769.1 hypothetical protein [Actinomadura physcomitrii]